VEHLISHMLDMRAVASHEPVGLHGAQVGVASLVGAMAWRYLAEVLNEVSAPTAPNREQVLADVKAAFAEIDPAGKLTAECVSDVTKKLDTWERVLPQASELIASWQANPALLNQLAPNAPLLAQALTNAGAPKGIDDLEPWITDEIWSWAVGHCQLMRNRFTVVDLLYFLGRWQPADVARVIEMANAAVAGAKK